MKQHKVLYNITKPLEIEVFIFLCDIKCYKKSLKIMNYCVKMNCVENVLNKNYRIAFLLFFVI